MVALTCHLGPAQLFGAGDGPLRASRLGSNLRLEWDANTDRHRSTISPGFARLAIDVEAMGGTFTVDGDTVTFRRHVSSRDELAHYVRLLLFTVPAALTATLADPVHLNRVDGWLGETHFRIEHVESISPLVLLDDAGLTERVTSALQSVQFITLGQNQRILAAVSYLHRAARLLATGSSPWEFMPEALLNYSKVLEVLFGDSRDAQRKGLAAAGFSEKEIEGRFVPVGILRDILDVAHPRLSQLDGARLQGVYLFLIGLEADFRRLLARVLECAMDGASFSGGGSGGSMSAADQRTIDRILAADNQRRAKGDRATDA